MTERTLNQEILNIYVTKATATKSRKDRTKRQEEIKTNIIFIGTLNIPFWEITNNKLENTMWSNNSFNKNWEGCSLDPRVCARRLLLNSNEVSRHVEKLKVGQGNIVLSKCRKIISSANVQKTMILYWTTKTHSFINLAHIKSLFNLLDLEFTERQKYHPPDGQTTKH